MAYLAEAVFYQKMAYLAKEKIGGNSLSKNMAYLALFFLGRQ